MGGVRAYIVHIYTYLEHANLKAQAFAQGAEGLVKPRDGEVDRLVRQGHQALEEGHQGVQVLLVE